MKTFFVFLILTISALSCKKVGTDETITTANEATLADSNVSDAETQTADIKLVTWAYWSDFKSDCLLGYWYCWEITTTTDAKQAATKDYISINDKKKLITFGIDNNVNPTYHKNFIKGSNFNFPQDTYIKSSIVKAIIGLDKKIYIKKGLYPLKIINGTLTISASYSLID